MGQPEIYEYLKKNKTKKYTTKQISKKLKINTNTATVSLRKLTKWQLIKTTLEPNPKRKKQKIQKYQYKKPNTTTTKKQVSKSTKNHHKYNTIINTTTKLYKKVTQCKNQTS